MTADEKTTKEILDMPPQLTAFEAMLGTFRPKGNSDAAAKVNQAILLEQCRSIEKSLTPDLRRERLLETIQAADQEEISLSLKQYAKQLRLSSALTGGLVGLILGVALTALGLVAAAHYLSAPPAPSVQPIREIHHYMTIQDQNGNPILPDFADMDRRGR